MCGVAGFLTQSGTVSHDALTEVALRMANVVCHRGPDHIGAWCDAENGVALGHSRLAIIDLSSDGRQPMLSASGRYVITYNGEIYNFESLRSELVRSSGRFTFRGHSDTEVMLAAFDRWGINAIKRFNGMFAFALWDRHTQKLFLARDRLGEKPLFYGWCNGVFLFGSELKSFHQHLSFDASIDRYSLALYSRYAYVPSGHSIFANVKKLEPGTLLEVTRDSINATLRPTTYWTAEEAVAMGQKNCVTCDEQTASDQLDELLRDAVRIRMVSDVPLGAFLSGGVDSSTVVALMQAQSALPIKTFSIGFHESEFNEARHAERVARHLGTDHTQLLVTPTDALDVIPKLPSMYDEPFADSSQIPTFLVARLARRSVTVALSGDGGDELFGGYTRHLLGPPLWRRIRRVPISARRVTARMLRFPSRSAWTKIEAPFSPALQQFSGRTALPDAVDKLASVLELQSFDGLYERWVSHWLGDEHLIIPVPIGDRSRARLSVTGLADFTDQMMFLDLITYLADDILTKVDRATMAVSLEARVPLLDHRVVEFAWRLPTQMKIRNGTGKQILRRVLYRYVPKDLIERPKSGFAMPVGTWLRGPLRDWAETLLAERRLREEGFFQPAAVRQAWREHLQSRGRHQERLWVILMFQAWLETLKSVRATRGESTSALPRHTNTAVVH